MLGALLALLALLGACTSDDAPARVEPVPAEAAGCGPVAADEVRGRVPPRHRDVALASYAADGAACAGVWLPTGDGFVPQGLAVAGSTAWVSGVDHDPRVCVVVRVDLRTGAVEDRADLPRCWHGGGIDLDEHGLWLVDTGQLLLLDADDLGLLRSWRIAAPVRGSFAAHDDAGLLGIGGWLPRRRGTLHWFDRDALLGPGVTEVGAGLAAGTIRTPPRSQGAAVLDGRVWFTQSVTRCGVLAGPGGRRRAFVPGSEGLARAGGSLWVVSEAGSAYYQSQGGRPVVPTLLRVDADAVLHGARPDCTP